MLATLEAVHMPLRVLSAGDAIYAQGDPADFVYNLVSGWVELYQDLPDGRRHVSKFHTAGGMFGFEPSGSTHCQGATAITSATICAMPLWEFNEMRAHTPAFNERFLWMLERDYHMSMDALTILAQGTALERVARLLCELAIRFCDQGTVQNGIEIKTPLTQKLVAEAVGMTAIHVNRVIRQLREQRVADLQDGVILVMNAKHLVEIAGMYPELAALCNGGSTGNKQTSSAATAHAAVPGSASTHSKRGTARV